MSKWTDVRDGVVAALDVKEVTESAKEQILASLVTDGIDAISAVADKFVVQVQAQADDETGWCAIRDRFVLPLLINGILWTAKLVLDKSAQSATNENR